MLYPHFIVIAIVDPVPTGKFSLTVFAFY